MYQRASLYFVAVTNGKLHLFSSATVTPHEEKQSVICLKPLMSTQHEFSDTAMMGASLLQPRKYLQHLQVNLLFISSLSPKDPPQTLSIFRATTVSSFCAILFTPILH